MGIVGSYRTQQHPPCFHWILPQALLLKLNPLTFALPPEHHVAPRQEELVRNLPAYAYASMCVR